MADPISALLWPTFAMVARTSVVWFTMFMQGIGVALSAMWLGSAVDMAVV